MIPPAVLPNFFIVGTSRSGTTSLYHLLRKHPQIYLPPVLEPRFFAFEGDPMRYRGPGDTLLASRVVTRASDYSALFGNVNGEPAIGDISPAYLSVAGSAERIARHCPDARIIVVLRNPVERAISSFRLERLDGFEPLESLSQALAAEEERKRARWSYVWQYRGRGRYHAQLRRFFDLFPRSRIGVYLYEDWFAPTPLPAQILDFLGLAPNAEASDASVRYNDTGPERFRAREIARFEPSPELVAELAEGYRDEIRRLEALIDRDLTAWLPC